MAAQSTDIRYRLGVTSIVVGGTVTTTEGDPDSPGRVTSGVLAVTTTTTADQLTEYSLSRPAGKSATSTWSASLLDDGRLAGVDSTTVAEPAAAWGTALKVGTTLLAAAAAVSAAPLTVLAAGGAGLVLGGVLVTSKVGRRTYAQSSSVPPSPTGQGTGQKGLDEVSPGAKIAPGFVAEHPDEAKVLSAYRVAVGRSLVAHASASLGAHAKPDGGRAGLRDRELALASVRRGAEHVEAVYAAWRASKVVTSSEIVSLSLPVSGFKTTEGLQTWVSTQLSTVQPVEGDVSTWQELARRHKVAVSVDVPPQGPHEAVNQVGPGVAMGSPASPTDQITYRPPRPVIISVWTIVDGTLHLRERSRVDAVVPGNETTLALGSTGSTGRAAATFSPAGALVQVSSESTGAQLQRARDVSSLTDTVTSGLTEGSAVGSLFAPPTAVERLAEEKAGRDLAELRDPTPDPLAKVTSELKLRQLQAQVRIAEQLASTSTALAVVVDVGSAG